MQPVQTCNCALCGPPYWRLGEKGRALRDGWDHRHRHHPTTKQHLMLATDEETYEGITPTLASAQH